MTGTYAALLVAAYLWGLQLSPQLWPIESLPAEPPLELPPASSPAHSDLWASVQFAIHRNGEADACSASHSPLQFHEPPLDTHSKYHVDALLTHALKDVLDPTSCGPTWDEAVSSRAAFLSYCDMGIDRTTIQLDHHQLIRVPGDEEEEERTLPCHYHTREGVRVTSWSQLAEWIRENRNGAKRSDDGPSELIRDDHPQCASSTTTEPTTKVLHLYAVPAGRVFMFAPKSIGEVFHLPHVVVHDDNHQQVSLHVLSLSPRILEISNFVSHEESARIVERALSDTTESHKMKRSSTGASGYTVNSRRTSENGFVTHSEEAQAVKRRSLQVLGLDVYEEALTDGLQVLRYNTTTAYVPHLDWIDDYQKREEHNFDSAGLGSNRFATILLYMSDLEEGDGGETVFSQAWPTDVSEEERVPLERALLDLRASGDVAGILEPDSWEEHMVAKCRSRFTVRPHSSRAVLFYSQKPDGTPDEMSEHGGCPVIRGEKWAANLWVWNAPRGGFPGAPTNPEVVKRNRAANTQNDSQKKASFSNSQTDETMKDAKLYFQSTFWGNLGFGDPDLYVNTFAGHEWNIKVGDTIVKTIMIGEERKQSYTI